MKLKQIIPTLLALAMVLSGVSYAAGDVGFADVPGDAWYADAVAYCRARGWMSGTSETTFSPDGTMTRAMLATVLYRQAGSPAVTGVDRFTDTEDSTWYSAAVRWASRESIINGYGNNRFGPGDPVTREQLVTILWRLDGSPAFEPGQTFADQSSIASFAVAAVAWAQAKSMIRVRDGNRFDPQGNATRAEVATALMNRDTTARVGTETEPATDEGGTGKLEVVVGDTVFTATFADTQAARELAQLLPLTIAMNEYGGFEKVGTLGRDLTANDARTTTAAGDIVLYHSNQIVMFYGSNAWAYTRIGKIDDLSGWAEALGSGNVSVTFRLAESR